MRSSWKSHFGFIMATSGAAIGLGNIQRFPYLVAEQGGAAFVFIYILCVLLLGIPLILVEFSLGRFAKKNAVDSILTIKPNSKWAIVGYLGILTAFFIFTYYSVIAGWTAGYAVQSASQNILPFSSFAANPIYTIGLLALFMGINAWIVSFELTAGIEKFSKIFIPLIFVILAILVVKCAMLPGNQLGYQFYLNPDFSKITWNTVLAAMSQAFFSLCIGEAVLITYGSYLSKKEDLVVSAVYIALFDLLIALFAGLVIFPAIFAFDLSPDQGIGLIFVVLPKVFMQMSGGAIFGTLFFILLALAALTTAMALLEMPVAYLVERKLISSRKKAVWITTGVGFLCAIPSAVSTGANSFFSQIQFAGKTGFLQIMDFICGDLGMLITGLLTCIFVAWVWGSNNAAEEIKEGSSFFAKISFKWQLLIKYLAPISIVIILYNSI